MAAKVESQRLAGIVKAVPSGDTIIVMENAKWGAKEKTVTLASIMAPRLARRGGGDEPFAWASREFLRKLCIGKNVMFRVDYTVPTIAREFGTVWLGDKNLAHLVVSQGLAKVKGLGQNKGEASPFWEDLKHAEEQAKLQNLGCWSSEREEAIRDLPPSAMMGDSSYFDAMGLVGTHKGIPLEAIVEHVRDGSTLRVYLLPGFDYVQVSVAGVQAPSTRLKPEGDYVPKSSNEVIAKAPTGSQAPASAAEKLVATSSTYVPEGLPNPIGLEAKHFTEMRVLNKNVRVVPEGVDKFSNLIGSVYYSEGEVVKDLAMDLIQNGFAKCAEWSANYLEGDVKNKLRLAAVQAQKQQIKIWKGVVSESKAIHDQNFTGKVIEVPTGDCIVVADGLAERRVYLSSIKAPKMGNPRSEDPETRNPGKYAREARELLRQRLLGCQVNVCMEYSRNNKVTKGSEATIKVMHYGSVFFEDDNTKTRTNIAEVLVARGYAEVVKHRDYEERSYHYDSLAAAEARACAGKKGVHSTKEYIFKHIADRTMASPKDAKAFLPFLPKKKIHAIVEHIFSGHRFKLYLPEESSYIAFSLSGVRCPAQKEPYSDEAIAFMRRRIMNRDVEIQVETVDKKSTYLGSLWMSDTNMAVALVQAGLANLQSFNLDWMPDGSLLKQAEQSAITKKLKIWENFTEVKEAATNVPETRRRNKPEMMVAVTDILDGGSFYVRKIEDDKVASIQEKLSSLSLGEAPEIDERFNPKEGDIVLAQFDEDKTWNRVMIVKAEPVKAEYEVFYIDYGNQGTVSYNNLRPLSPSVPSGPGLAQLCKLAYIKVPALTEECGEEAAFLLSNLTINGPNKFKAIIEEKDNSSVQKGQGRSIGPVLEVILMYPSDEKINENTSIGGGAVENIVIDDDNEFPEINKVEKKSKVVNAPKENVPKKEGKKKYRKIDLEVVEKKVEKSKCFSVNASILQSGLAKLDRTRGPKFWEKKEALEKLEAYEKEAKAEKLGIWEYGDVPSDDEDNKDRPVVRRAAAIKK